MIKGIIIVNNHGKPRLLKFYQTVESESLQQSVIRRVFQQVSSRPDSFCNYLEGIVPEWGDHIKLIYRHYATLYFVFAVDSQESDLGILDLIQVFVEALDKCFENVCELDLIFHSGTYTNSLARNENEYTKSADGKLAYYCLSPSDYVRSLMHRND
jgi:AP-3 complex subunit sigma